MEMAKKLAEDELKDAPAIDLTANKLHELSKRLIFLEAKLPEVENTLA